MRLRKNFVRLPWRIDAETLAREIQAVPEAEWRAHPEGAPGNTALPLVAVGGDPDDNDTRGPVAPTPMLAELPYTRQVLAALGSTIGRTRLMRIANETELGSHVDTNYYWWHHLRVHVPVVTSPEVVFHAGDESAHMGAGEVWVFDTWHRHRVDNPTGSARIHLVADTVGGAELWDLIEHPDRTVIELPFDRTTDPALSLESSNWPVVMAPDEVESTVEALLEQTRSVDRAGATRAESVLSPFRHEWRNLDARFGTSAEGRGPRLALVERTTDQVRSSLSGIKLPNDIELRQALLQLVLLPAVGPALGGPRPAPPQPIGATHHVAAPAGPRPRPVPVSRSALAGAPRVNDPVFIVCPPRSGSSLLFETLARAPGLHTIGGESHGVIEGITALSPAAHGWDSNRLDASDATDGASAFLKEQFVIRLRDRDGARARGGSVRMLEKTPKNALRVPFLAAAFPDARFIYLYRDPRETISSMLDAWRSGRFVTYPQLDGWHGSPWSLLLTPGWRELDGRPLAEVVARQWATTVDVLLDDLDDLDPDRWCVASYDQLLSDPHTEIERLCGFLDLEWDDELAEPLPESRHTLDSPHPDKWHRNADELGPHLALIGPAAERARERFATAPRVTAVAAGPSADRPRPSGETTAGRQPTPSSARPASPDQAQEAGEEGPGDLTAQELFASRHTASFRALLETLASTLLVTTYQADRLIFVRTGPDGINTHFRSLRTPMGVAYDGRRLAIGTRGEIIVFQNQPALAARLDPPGDHDACFVARTRYATGDIRVHDLAWAGDELWVVNTRFSCLATLDGEHSFVPRWQPPFITGMAAEDRCHLNGLAVVDGEPRYVTVLGITDERDGWRERKADGGAVLDVRSGAVVAAGLSMPHSPRWRDGKLWVLQSGTGSLGIVDLASGRVDEVARVPGFARGLTFAGRYALIGLSRVREHVFDGLPLTRDRDQELQCGVWVVDTETGETVGHLEFGGLVQEIFELTLLPGMRWPELVEPGAPLADSAFVLP